MFASRKNEPLDAQLSILDIQVSVTEGLRPAEELTGNQCWSRTLNTKGLRPAEELTGNQCWSRTLIMAFSVMIFYITKVILRMTM